MEANDLDQLDKSIRQSREVVDTGKALDRLLANPDFQTIVMKGYLEKEAVRLVHVKASSDMQTPEKQEAILKQIDAIGTFIQYLTVVRLRALHATKQLVADEATREELLQEEVAV